MVLDFEIRKSGRISKYFIENGISCFQEAGAFVQNLPYKRNGNKEDDLCVINDGGGTCSTKHALLKLLADENGIAEVKLMLGIFKMNVLNTPKIFAVLEKYRLTEIPEAHNYLRCKNRVLDFTKKNSSPENFISDLMEEIEIQPNQISGFKVDFHKEYLKKYLNQNPQIPYSLEEFWEIREECIAALQQ
ncbi:hypothetical protein MTP09_05530 [Chryseobacterium suipulveris]|uniref:Uncharacterized protein n=1 Tax=Chryseobacterium suipulveris TaxID=2929800 RepID=A0ABY4BSC4_9FLAO|nr:hypothetical protein [Chryseobacterium suipulveris]UOE42098.1 hypothetical protein MTP09_05530 [Chryseobacterium suipulveris]